MSNESYIWDYLLDKFGNEFGVAGLMGNLFAESGLSPINMQDSYERKLGYNDKTYTKAVDEGKYTNFVNDQVGYGLAQWTYYSRKQNLLRAATVKKKSIGDLDFQLDFLYTELVTSFPNVVTVIKSGKTVKEVSDYVLTKFEAPGDQSAAVKKLRSSYGQSFYNKYAKKVNTMSETDKKIEALIATATKEIGYLEKKNSNNLDDPIANAGSANYTKYWRDSYPLWQGQYWCAIFVYWCFVQTFGETNAKKLLKHGPYTYVPTLAGMTSNKTPRKGDVVCFYKSTKYYHTGIVVDVTSTTVTTIEGNTSSGTSVVANGGGVFKKTYKRSSLNAKNVYFTPDYSLATVVSNTKSTTKSSTPAVLIGKCSVNLKTFLVGAVDNQIKTLQMKLNYLGYKGKDGKTLDIDGELGENTAFAVSEFQKKKNFGANTNWGTVAGATWLALLNE